MLRNVMCTLSPLVSQRYVIHRGAHCYSNTRLPGAIFARHLQTSCTQYVGLPDDIDEVVNVIELNCEIDKSTEYLKSRGEDGLEYSTPSFRAKALVSIQKECSGDEWAVGWIQAVCRTLNTVEYGERGCTRVILPLLAPSDTDTPYLTFEGFQTPLPQLQEGEGTFEMINDGDDSADIPWVNREGVQMNEKDTKMVPWITQVKYSSNSTGIFPWQAPVGPADPDESFTMTRLMKKTEYFTWLAVRSLVTGELKVLRTIRWNVGLTADVYPSKPLGECTEVISAAPHENSFEVLENNLEISGSVLELPRASQVQTWLWHPKETPNKPQVIKAPAAYPAAPVASVDESNTHSDSCDDADKVETSEDK